MSQDELPFFPMFPKDFLTSPRVRMMTPAQVGGYIILLCTAWDQTPRGTLPDNDEELAVLSGLGDEWAKNKTRILAPFVLKDGRWVSPRLAREAALAAERMANRKRASQIALDTRWNKPRIEYEYGPNAVHKPSASETKLSKPLPPAPAKASVRPLSANPAKLVLPEALDTPEFREALAHFVDHRKHIKHEMTQKALELTVKDCEKLGLEQAIKSIETSIKRGWQGIFPPEKHHSQTKATTNWKPPTMEQVIEYAKSKKWTYSFGKHCWSMWNEKNWKHFGVEITSDQQWKDLMPGIEWKP